MEHYKLTHEDMEICQRQNAKNFWGFDASMLEYQLRKHWYAWTVIKACKNDPRCEDIVYKMERDIAMAEERLTDANFHKFCSLLSKHKYNEANEWIRREVE